MEPEPLIQRLVIDAGQWNAPLNTAIGTVQRFESMLAGMNDALASISGPASQATASATKFGQSLSAVTAQVQAQADAVARWKAALNSGGGATAFEGTVGRVAASMANATAQMQAQARLAADAVGRWKSALSQTVGPGGGGIPPPTPPRPNPGFIFPNVPPPQGPRPNPGFIFPSISVPQGPRPNPGFLAVDRSLPTPRTNPGFLAVDKSLPESRPNPGFLPVDKTLPTARPNPGFLPVDKTIRPREEVSFWQQAFPRLADYANRNTEAVSAAFVRMSGTIRGATAGALRAAESGVLNAPGKLWDLAAGIPDMVSRNWPRAVGALAVAGAAVAGVSGHFQQAAGTVSEFVSALATRMPQAVGFVHAFIQSVPAVSAVMGAVRNVRTVFDIAMAGRRPGPDQTVQATGAGGVSQIAYAGRPAVGVIDALRSVYPAVGTAADALGRFGSVVKDTWAILSDSFVGRGVGAIGRGIAAGFSYATDAAKSFGTTVTGFVVPAFNAVVGVVGNAVPVVTGLFTQAAGLAVNAASSIGSMAFKVVGLGTAFAGVVAVGLGFGSVGTVIHKAANVTMALIEQVVTLGMEYQRTRVAFDVFTGGAEQGGKLFNELQDVAARTPYSFRQFSAASQVLLGMGADAKDVTAILARLGDVAAGDADRLRRLTLAFGEVMAEGRLSGRRLLQFTAAGLSVNDFAQTMGITPRELRHKMETGGISSSVVVDTINRVTSPGGRFFDLSNKQLGNVGGQAERVSDRLQLLGGRLGDQLFKELDVAGLVNKFGQAVETLAPVIYDKVVQAFRVVQAVAQGVFDFLRAGWGAVGDSVGEFLNSLTATPETLEAVRKGAFDAAAAVLSFGKAAYSVFLSIWNALKDIASIIPHIMIVSGLAMIATGAGAVQGALLAAGGAALLGTGAFDGLSSASSGLQGALEGVGGVAKGVTSAVGGLAGAVKGLFDSIPTGLGKVAAGVGLFGAGLASGNPLGIVGGTLGGAGLAGLGLHQFIESRGPLGQAGLGGLVGGIGGAAALAGNPVAGGLALGYGGFQVGRGIGKAILPDPTGLSYIDANKPSVRGPWWRPWEAAVREPMRPELMPMTPEQKQDNRMQTARDLSSILGQAINLGGGLVPREMPGGAWYKEGWESGDVLGGIIPREDRVNSVKVGTWGGLWDAVGGGSNFARILGGGAAAVNRGGKGLDRFLGGPVDTEAFIVQTIGKAVSFVPGLMGQLNRTVNGPDLIGKKPELDPELQKILDAWVNKVKEGLTPLDQFNRALSQIDKAFPKWAEDDPAKFVGPPAPDWAMNFDPMRAAKNAARFDAVQDLLKETNKLTDKSLQLPGAAFKGSSEAVDAINKANLQQDNKEQEIIDALKAAADQRQRQIEEIVKTNEILDRLAEQGIVLGEGSIK